MTKGQLIDGISNAIIRQEGAAPTALNPGNIRTPAWITNPVVHNGFWVPKSRAEGLAGLAHLVALRIAEGWSLTQIIESYAPAADGNNPIAYIQNVANWVPIPNTAAPLYTLITG